MADRPQPLNTIDLEQALRDLGPRLAYPPTPPLAVTVRRRLAERPAPPEPFWHTWFSRRRLALALLVVVLLFGAVLVASPTARTVVADRLGLRGVAIIQAPSVPTPAPTPQPTPVPVGVRLQLGRQASLDQARQLALHPVHRPTVPELGEPDEVYLMAAPSHAVVFVYFDRPGLPPAAETGVSLLMTQFQGTVAPEFLGKIVGAETHVEMLTVNGERGIWLEGAPHAFFYYDRSGQVHHETIRLAANVLLWEQGDLTFRLEGALSKEAALRIAASVR